MALNWNSITSEHVTKACEHLRADIKPLKVKLRGIYVVNDGQLLPAKQVIRVAYLIANNMPLDTKLKFSSGESTVKRLRGLGFQVERKVASNSVPEQIPSKNKVGIT